MKLLRHIPNAITSGNLLCGCLALYQIFAGDLVLACLLVFLAALLDFFDGFAARLLKVGSPIGKDLDSLADVVTFGVVPGFMMFRLLQFSVMASEQKHVFWIAIEKNIRDVQLSNSPDLSSPYVAYLPYLALIIPVFSAIRLARFNNDTRQSESFIGLPTPANALFIASLILNCQNPSGWIFWINNPVVLSLFCVVSAYLLVAELPLLALKFKDFGWKNNEIRYLLIFVCLLLLVILRLKALPILILVYVLFSIVNNIFFKARH